MSHNPGVSKAPIPCCVDDTPHNSHICTTALCLPHYSQTDLSGSASHLAFVHYVSPQCQHPCCRITPFCVHTNNCSLYPIKLTLLKIAKLANTKRPEAASLLSLFFFLLYPFVPRSLFLFSTVTYVNLRCDVQTMIRLFKNR